LAGDGEAWSLASSRIFSLKPGLSGDGYELGPPELSSRSLTGELLSRCSTSRFSSSFSSLWLNLATLSLVTFVSPINGLAKLEMPYSESSGVPKSSPLTGSLSLVSTFCLGLGCYYCSSGLLPLRRCLPSNFRRKDAKLLRWSGFMGSSSFAAPGAFTGYLSLAVIGLEFTGSLEPCRADL